MSGPITSPYEVDEPDPFITQPGQLDAPTEGPVTSPTAEMGNVPDPMLTSIIQQASAGGLGAGAAIGPLSGVSRQTSGVTPAGLKQGYSVIDKAKAEARGEFDAVKPEYAQQEERAQEHFGDMVDSVGAQGEEEGQHWGRLLGLQKRISDFHETAAQAEASIYEQSKADRAGYLSEYREQLAGVRALAMTTGNPLGAMTTSQGLSLAAAQFAQGFLGAQGIHIDVSGQVDKWVDRSIQEHQMKINNARQGAEDQLHLYEIARQSSEDEYEARQRFRGFVLAGFQAQIEAEGARFNSSVAGERAKQKSAELQFELDKVLTSIGDRRQARYEQIEKRKLDEVKTLGDLAHQKEMERIGWAGVSAQREKAAKKEKGLKAVTDIETQKGYGYGGHQPLLGKDGKMLMGPDGKPIPVMGQVGMTERPANSWHFDPEDKDSLQKGTAARNSWAKYNDRWEKLVNLRKDAYDDLEGQGFTVDSTKGFPSIARRESEKFRRFEASFKEFIRQQIYEESGKAVTEQELQDKLAQYPMEQLFQQGDNYQIFMDMRENRRKDFERSMETYSLEGQAGMTTTASPRTAEQFKISEKDNGPQVTPLQQLEGEARQGSRKSVDTPATTAYGKWQQQQREMDPEGGKNKYTIREEDKFAQIMDTMAQVALDPHPFASQTGEPAKDLKEQALRRLEAMGRDKSVPNHVRDYAQYLAGRIIDDPDSLQDDLNISVNSPDRTKFH